MIPRCGAAALRRLCLAFLACSLAAPAAADPTVQEIRDHAQQAFDELDREAGETKAPEARPDKPAPRPRPKPAAPAEPRAPAQPPAVSSAAAGSGAEFRPRFYQAAAFPAGAASQVKLEDGASLSVPAGALSAAAKASLERLDLSGPSEDSVRVYDARVEGAALGKPATLSLPLEGDVGAPEVLHYDSAKRRWERLIGTLSADSRSVSVEMRSFSPVAISQAGPFERLSGTMTRRPPVAPLEVPYYHQGETMWCWAAALTMLEGYRSRATKIWELAAYFGVGPHDGLSLPAPRLNAYLSAQCPACKSEYKVFFRQGSVDAYIKAQLDQGRPVWLDIRAALHALVAVGYDADNVYVHEPYGSLIAQTRGIGALSAAYQDSLHGLPLAAYAIPWARFDSDVWDAILHNLTMTDDVIHWQGGRLNPVYLLLPSVYAVTLSAPASANKPLSVSLFPQDQKWPSFELFHSARDNKAKAPVSFHWDGRLPGGFTFRHPLDKAGAGTLCNGDVLESIKPLLSNSSDRELEAELRVVFDGKILARKSVKAAPRLAQVPVAIPEREFDERLRLVESPVALGAHELAVEAWHGGALMDRAALRVKVAPASVTGTKAREDAVGELIVSWEKNPEEAFKDADIVYRVKRSPGLGRADEILLGETEPGAHRFKARPEDKREGQLYSVWAYDRKSKLESQYAVYRAAEKDGPAASEEWRLVETSFEVWDGKTVEDGRRVFASGRSAQTPSKLSRWSVGPGEFSFFNSSTSFKISARWDKMPETLVTGKTVKFALEASIEGPQSAEVGIGPVGAMCEWSIKMTNEDPSVRKLGLGFQKCDGEAPPAFHRIDLAGAAGKPRVQSGRMELELGIRKTSFTAKAKPGDVGSSLFLEMNAGNLAKVHWTFQKAAPSLKPPA